MELFLLLLLFVGLILLLIYIVYYFDYKNNQVKYKFNKKIQHRPIIADKKLYLHLKGRFDTQMLIFK